MICEVLGTQQKCVVRVIRHEVVRFQALSCELNASVKLMLLLTMQLAQSSHASMLDAFDCCIAPSQTVSTHASIKLTTIDTPMSSML